jgi:hypothetical protein
MVADYKSRITNQKSQIKKLQIKNYKSAIKIVLSLLTCVNQQQG